MKTINQGFRGVENHKSRLKTINHKSRKTSLIYGFQSRFQGVSMKTENHKSRFHGQEIPVSLGFKRGTENLNHKSSQAWGGVCPVLDDVCTPFIFSRGPGFGEGRVEI